MMHLHPHQRQAMEQLRETMPAIRASEARLRRIDWLLLASGVAAFLALTFWNATASSAWRGVIAGLMFALGAHSALAFKMVATRRRSYEQLRELDDVAALSLAYHDDDDDA